MRYLLAIVSLIFSVSTGKAQEWVIGAGYADFSDSLATDESLVVLEYHAAPFLENGRFSLGFAGAAVAHLSGDLFVGGGLAGVYQINDRWFIEGSVLPGYFRASSPQNNLGSDFEIRSLIGFGVVLDSGSRLSIALTHKSNASTAPVNPGVNGIQIRVRHRF